MTNNELRQHKKRDGVKWFFTAVAFVLVFALIAGLCMQIFGKGKIQPSNWFKKPDTEQKQPETTDSGAIISPLKSNGIELYSMAVPVAEYSNYGIDTQSVDSVYNLSVTYTPANTTFQETDYTIAFKNSNSEWASGKVVTDYATVTQSETGSKDAQLQILKPFSEQIIVTATNTRNSSIYVKTTVDYVCTDFSLSIATTVYVDGDIDIWGASWGNGTVEPEMVGNIFVLFNLGNGFVEYMSNYGFTVSQIYEYVSYDGEDDLYNGTAIITFYDVVKSAGNYSSLDNDRKAVYLEALCQFYGNHSDGDSIAMVTYKYNRIYDGVNYGTVTVDDWQDFYGLNFGECFEIKATNMAINNSHIIAG